VAMQSKARGLGLLKHWNHGFESLLSHGCLSTLFCVVLCMCRGLATSSSPVQGFLLKSLKEFTASKINSELEQARGPNP
jgi:hypothetical protein